MKKLEITFSEEDVNLALETYINRFFLPHRQVRIESVRSSMREGKSSLTATVLPAPAEAIPTIPELTCVVCGHSRTFHEGGGACNVALGITQTCPCAQFRASGGDGQ